MSERTSTLLLAVLLIVGASVLRLLPHPANFAPVMAIAIFGGAVLPRKIAVWVPLAAMVATDCIIGLYTIAPIVWGCYLAAALMSSWMLARPSFAKVALLAVGSSVSFFTVTNFAVWVAGGMYDHSWSGLLTCYTMALPFFRNSLASDLLYTGVLFGVLAGTKMLVRPRVHYGKIAG